VHELRQQYPLDGLLNVMALKRSTFYYQMKIRGTVDKYAELKGEMQAVFDLHKGRYGYRRIAAAVQQAGHTVAANTVQSLMGKLGLKSLVRPKKYKSFKGEIGAVAPNLLERDFKATVPNEKWVTDVTEFKLPDGKVFLSTVMDLCTSEIIAHEIHRRPSLGLVMRMLNKALGKLGVDEKPILHSDQGWQYRMARYRDLLIARGVVPSMSRKGNCHDNAAMESFFGVLKSEFFHLEKFDSSEQLRHGLEEYIHYYNHIRMKLKLGGKSPAQYRTLLQPA
jgi:transposase InsO family protein